MNIKQVIKKDFYRIYGTYDKLTYIRYAHTNYQFRFIKAYRFATYYKERNKLRYFYYKIRYRSIAMKLSLQIPIGTEIGEGFMLPHWGGIVINQACKLGKNINIAQGVTIGQINRGSKKGCPTIGNNVCIGANSVIVGKIKIGSDVMISPCTFVNFDVPSHSIVMGNPAKWIYRKNATKYYVNNEV